MNQIDACARAFCRIWFWWEHVPKCRAMNKGNNPLGIFRYFEHIVTRAISLCHTIGGDKLKLRYLLAILMSSYCRVPSPIFSPWMSCVSHSDSGVVFLKWS